MPNTFFTSDLHFFHERVIEFCNRPHSNVEEMNEFIIQRWNEQVMPGDIVWQLGDFCFGTDKPEKIKKIVKRLNGNIGFLWGNHDKSSHFEELPNLFGGRILFMGHYKEISISKKRICMFHFPIVDHHNNKHGAYMIHGHQHSSYQVEGKVLDVGWDSAKDKLNEYRLWTFEDIDRFMRNRETVYYGHHKEEM